MIKPAKMLCETVLNLSKLCYVRYFTKPNF